MTYEFWWARGRVGARRSSTSPTNRRSQFGEERLLQALGTLPANHTAQDAVTALTDAVRSFTGSDGIDDDQAVLVLTAR
ncbi:hypothetical protein ABZW47_30365 [Streptomyces sp. NPDC004549]|uniref:hypothetical protein n=1 Tax=Streptomyces sp. NPDC004549 TaxID=3154283 RepID=UPI0033AA8821